MSDTAEVREFKKQCTVMWCGVPPPHVSYMAHKLSFIDALSLGLSFAFVTQADRIEVQSQALQILVNMPHFEPAVRQPLQYYAPGLGWSSGGDKLRWRNRRPRMTRPRRRTTRVRVEWRGAKLYDDLHTALLGVNDGARPVGRLHFGPVYYNRALAVDEFNVQAGDTITRGKIDMGVGF
jgi:hypothetical protein